MVRADPIPTHQNRTIRSSHARGNRKLVDEIKQAHNPAEEASLTGIRPLKRLDYLNSRAEDPSLWNDPQEAQKLMRERQGLEDGIAGDQAA